MQSALGAVQIPIQSVFLGSRIALRAPKVSDARQIIEMQMESADFLAPWFPARAPDEYDWKATRQRILENRRDFRADRAYKFVFTLGAQGPVIGRVSLSQVFGRSRCAAVVLTDASPLRV